MMTFRQFAEHMERAADAVPEAIAGVVVEVTALAVVRAKDMIGTYQPGWDPLHEATLMGFWHKRGPYIPGKNELGFAPPDNPLLRDGGMRDSIEGEAIDNTGVIGSPEKKMLWQEMGTPNADYPIEPRPVLAKAVMDSIPDIERLCGEAMVRLLTPEGI
ncbi:MAG TPA: hypothetical protein VL614_14885 [Acetobacteraceae bacterium]|jgi:hypothetical protein|nr:hypothetical protein [Acetobacteraceae bacterium]